MICKWFWGKNEGKGLREISFEASKNIRSLKKNVAFPKFLFVAYDVWEQSEKAD
jgi:hypothetical protein